MSRIVVIGTSCCGKTTLARRLAECLDCRHVELDALHWLPHWTPRPIDEFRDLVRGVSASDRWVIDGNYSVVRDLYWSRATVFVWLDYSFPTILGRGLRRTVKRSITRETLFSGNRESFRQSFLSRDSILVWILTTFRRRRRRYRRLFQEMRASDPSEEGRLLLTLRRPREAELFLRFLSQGRRPTEAEVVLEHLARVPDPRGWILSAMKPERPSDSGV